LEQTLLAADELPFGGKMSLTVEIQFRDPNFMSSDPSLALVIVICGYTSIKTFSFTSKLFFSSCIDKDCSFTSDSPFFIEDFVMMLLPCRSLASVTLGFHFTVTVLFRPIAMQA
jgi:hypothetical protein